MKELVKVYYASGWKLLVPAAGMELRLFFEWMILYQKENDHPPSFKIVSHSVGDNEPAFKICFDHLGRNEADNLRDYITANL